MTPSDFAARASAVLGGRGWRVTWAEATGVHYGTVAKWLDGRLGVPEYALAQLETLEALAAAGAPLPERWRRNRAAA